MEKKSLAPSAIIFELKQANDVKPTESDPVISDIELE
jgi:hypothetical protein